MRKTTLLLILLGFMATAFAQTKQCIIITPKEEIEQTSHFLKSAKSTGDIFWSEDFAKEDWVSTVDQVSTGGYLYNKSAMPAGWTVFDGTENDFFWHWSDVGPRGANISAEPLIPDDDYFGLFNLPEGNTFDNGVMLLESDFYNTTELGETVTDPLDMDSYLTYGPIDLSNAPGVIVGLNTLYIFCCKSDATFELQVSADYNPADETSAHWTPYSILKSTGINEFTYINERMVELNISAVAAGQSKVYFRFHTSGSAHYFAVIDDIVLKQPATYDLIVEDGWADYMEIAAGAYFHGGYSMIAKDVVSEFKQFRTKVANNGLEAANNVELVAQITKDDAVVETLTSSKYTISSLAFDTVKVAASFSPTDIASYQVSMTVANADWVDEKPSNNGYKYNFETTENTWSRVRHNATSDWLTAGPRDWVDGGYDGDIITVEYEVPTGKNVFLSGINVYMAKTTREPELAAIAAGQFQMKARAFVYEVGADDPTDLNLYSDLYTIKTEDLGSWIYLPFIDEGDLYKGAGDYYVGIETYTASDDQTLRFEVGADNRGIKQPGGNSLWFSTAKASWYGTGGDNYAIDLMLNMPQMVNFTVNYDMSKAIADSKFNPESDVVYLTGSFADWAEPGLDGSVKANYNADTKIATAKVLVDAKTTYEFKGFINAGTTNPEWDGVPNRTVTITDKDVTINAVFGDKTTDITSSKLNFASVYPNPFNETLNLNNLEEVSKITICNVLGQQVMKLTQIEQNMTLSTANLNKGVYMVILTDIVNNTRTLRVVKQ